MPFYLNESHKKQVELAMEGQSSQPKMSHAKATEQYNKIHLLIICFYLAKFDRKALSELGYQTQTKAFKEIGKALGVPSRTVQNRRDDFDVLFPYREGWKKRSFSPVNREVIEKFENSTEFELRHVVIEILANKGSESVEGLDKLVEEIDLVGREKPEVKYSPQRGITGKKAEEFYIQYQKKYSTPIQGELKDMRDRGCGYDFEINGNSQKAYVEVKGLDGNKGGILFTSKEWEMAHLHKNLFYLAIVKNVGDESLREILIIKNPADNLKPRKRISKVVNVSFHLNEADIVDTRAR